MKAYRQKKVFRVIIVMPLMPSFEGQSVPTTCMEQSRVTWGLKQDAVHLYRRVRIKRPWAGNLRMQRKRGVGAKCIVRRIWHVVPAHHPEKAGIFDKSLFLL